MELFADTFRPHGFSVAGGGASPHQQAFGATASPRLADLSLPATLAGTNPLLARSRQQVQHYRLWNYIAVSRNAMSAAKAAPCVGYVTGKSSATGPAAQGWLRPKQQSFLRENYGAVLQSEAEKIKPAPATHPLVTLLQEINSEDWWTSFAFESYMMWGLTGMFCWWVVPNGLGLPAEMWVIPTHWVEPVYDGSGRLLHYNVAAPAKTIKLPPEEVIWASSKSPLDKTSPWSPLCAGSEWIYNSEKIEKVREQSLRQGVFPSALVELDPAHYQLPDDTLIQMIGDKFVARYSGEQNYYRPLIAPPGVTYKEWGRKPTDMDFGPGSEQMRDAVMALHGTPRAVAGLAHDLNRANIDGSQLIYAEHTLIPMHVWMAGVLTFKLARRFDPRLRVWFEDPRPINAEQERLEDETDWKLGAITPDERRMKRGREPLNTEASQKTYVAMSVTPLEDFEESADDRKQASNGGNDPSGGGSANGGDSPGSGGKSDETGGSDEGPESKNEQRQGLTGRGLAISYSRSRPVSQAQQKRLQRVAQSYLKLHSRYEVVLAKQLKTRLWLPVKKIALEVFDGGATSRSAPSPGDMVQPGKFRDMANKVLRPVWSAMAAAGIEFEQRALGLDAYGKQSQADGYPDIEIELPENLKQEIAAFLREREAGIWGKLLQTTHRALEDAIAEGIAAGEGMDAIRDRVENALDGRIADATTIARTEATASLNFGQQALREEEGLEEKIWISTADALTRDTHLAAHSQVVANTAAFNVGNYQMQHPGDGSLGAPASEIVDCRCTATGYVD